MNLKIQNLKSLLTVFLVPLLIKSCSSPEDFVTDFQTNLASFLKGKTGDKKDYIYLMEYLNPIIANSLKTNFFDQPHPIAEFPWTSESGESKVLIKIVSKDKIKDYQTERQMLIKVNNYQAKEIPQFIGCIQSFSTSAQIHFMSLSPDQIAVPTKNFGEYFIETVHSLEPLQRLKVYASMVDALEAIHNIQFHEKNYGMFYQKQLLYDQTQKEYSSYSEEQKKQIAEIRKENSKYQNMYAHNDIKPSKFLYNPKDSSVKLINLESINQNIHFVDGTVDYLDPTKMAFKLRLTDKLTSYDVRTNGRSDFWALGVTIYQIENKIINSFNSYPSKYKNLDELQTDMKVFKNKVISTDWMKDRQINFCTTDNEYCFKDILEGMMDMERLKRVPSAIFLKNQFKKIMLGKNTNLLKDITRNISGFFSSFMDDAPTERDELIDLVSDREGLNKYVANEALMQEAFPQIKLVI